MRNFLDTVESSDVIEGIDAWRETSVETEDLVVDKGCEGEVVKEVGEVLPYVGVAVFPKTFIVEAIHLCDLARFVIATEDGDALRVSDFEGDEESDSFDGIVASINIIALLDVSLYGVSFWCCFIPMKR